MTEINWNRTDLIDEAEEVVAHQSRKEKKQLQQTNGISIHEETHGRLRLSKVTVDEQGQQAIGKKAGTYITLSVPTLQVEDEQGFTVLQKHFVQQLKELHKELQLTANSKVLVIGLGNKTITADAIGPFTIDAMYKEQPNVENSPFVLYAPGVTGQTGFETKDFIAAVAEKIQPALVLVIDALATRGSARLCKTIQMTNTGIHPGSGVGNHRAEVSFDTIGIPVTAIGIPTVVEGPVMIADAIEKMFRSIAAKVEEKQKPSSRLSVTNWQPDPDQELDFHPIRQIFGEWSTWSADDRRQLLEEVYSTQPDHFIVTPKEMDIWLLQYAYILSTGIFAWAKAF